MYQTVGVFGLILDICCQMSDVYLYSLITHCTFFIGQLGWCKLSLSSPPLYVCVGAWTFACLGFVLYLATWEITPLSMKSGFAAFKSLMNGLQVIFTIRVCLCQCFIILYYTILYYTILYYTILYYTILYYTILYYTIPNTHTRTRTRTHARTCARTWTYLHA